MNKKDSKDYNALRKKGEQHIVADRYEEALKYYNKALPLCEAAVGIMHADTADIYNKIGVVYLNMGNYKISKEWLNKALSIYTELGVQDKPSIATVYNNLGFISSSQGQFDDALKNYTLAKDIREKTIGKKHKNTARSYSNIATVHIKQRNFDTAYEWLQKAYALHRRMIFDSNKYDHATTCNNIGMIFSQKAKLDAALKWYKKAIRVAKRTKKTTKSILVTIYSNISAIYRGNKDFSTALKYQKMALDYADMIYSGIHPKKGHIYSQMASNSYKQKDYDTAIEYAMKVIEIREKTVGVDHYETALSYSNAGIYYFSKNDYPNAIKYYKKSSDSYYNVYDENSEIYLKIYYKLADSYFRNQQYTEAIQVYENILNVREKIDSTKKIVIITLCHQIAVCYDKLFNEEAIKWYKKCIEHREELTGDNDLTTANVMSSLARNYFKQKKYDDSLRWYDKVITIINSKDDINYNFLLDMYVNKVTIYKIMNQADKAIDICNEALSLFGKNNADEKHIIVLTYTLAFAYAHNKDYLKALNRFKDSLELMEKRKINGNDTGNEYIYAQIYHEMAIIYLNFNTDYVSSISYLEKSISIHKLKYGSDINLSKMYRDIAFPHFRLAQYDKAEEYCHMALEILINQFDETHESVVEINRILNTIHSGQYGSDDFTQNDITTTILQ